MCGLNINRTDAWIILDLIPGIGPVSVLKLLEIFHTPEAIISAPPARIGS
jgi:excinuclease UvrABC nuclease subunit